MASWVERLAWVVVCPTCYAPAGEPCVRRDHGTALEYNHAKRNARFHAYHSQDVQADPPSPEPGSTGQRDPAA